MQDFHVYRNTATISLVRDCKLKVRKNFYYKLYSSPALEMPKGVTSKFFANAWKGEFSVSVIHAISLIKEIRSYLQALVITLPFAKWLAGPRHFITHNISFKQIALLMFFFRERVLQEEGLLWLCAPTINWNHLSQSVSRCFWVDHRENNTHSSNCETNTWP